MDEDQGEAIASCDRRSDSIAFAKSQKADQPSLTWVTPFEKTKTCIRQGLSFRELLTREADELCCVQSTQRDLGRM